MATRLIRRSALKTFKEVRQKNAELFVKKISWVTGACKLLVFKYTFHYMNLTPIL